MMIYICVSNVRPVRMHVVYILHQTIICIVSLARDVIADLGGLIAVFRLSLGIQSPCQRMRVFNRLRKVFRVPVPFS